jgi:hypothetical protein
MIRLSRFAPVVALAGLALLVANVGHAAVIREEHVTGGALDLVWNPGFGVTANAHALTLDPSDPAYANPSGDHTVLVATSMPVDSGGIVLSATSAADLGDYTWEGWFFTGAGNTRRGLVVRADPLNGFQSCYQFVIQSGLFQINFRRLVNGAPTTLGTWFANTLPAGVPQVNTWHKMKVIAAGTSFRCFFDDFELTTTPIVDATFAAGYVGVYNFRFDLGSVPVYFDDLVLSGEPATPARRVTWGAVKSLYRN